MKDFKVPALEKGLEILETLSASMAPMSLAELSRALGRSSSELFRMIGFLEERGYVAKEPHSGSYRLTLKLYELAHTHSPVENLIRAAAIPMRELAVAVGESCHLSVLRKSGLLVLLQEDSPLKYRLSVEVGGTFDALNTVSGRLLMAYLSPEEMTWLLRQHEGYLAMNEREQQELHEKLAAIRELGYSHAEGEFHLGVSDYAVLVGNERIGLMAALAVPCLQLANRQAAGGPAVLEQLRLCAARITESLGLTTQTRR